MVSKKSKQRTGITHFPLEDEKISQRQVPPRGKKKEGASPTTRQGKTGKRLSRKSGRAGILSSNNDFEGSGGKGGETGGSRAGLLASRKSSKRDLEIRAFLPETAVQILPDLEVNATTTLSGSPSLGGTIQKVSADGHLTRRGDRRHIQAETCDAETAVRIVVHGTTLPKQKYAR